MKKIVMLITLMAIMVIGCRNAQVLHTYYGDFSTDTLGVLIDDTDGSSCYLVSTEFKDSFNVKRGTIIIEGPIEIYYNSQKDIYYKRYPASGNSDARILKYNPYDNTYE